MVEDKKHRSALLADLNRHGGQLMKKWVGRLINEAKEKNADAVTPIRILDIGCGTSTYLQDIDPKGLEMVFWDMEEQAKLIRALNYNPHQHGTFEQIKFPDDVGRAGNKGPFDIIISSLALHEFYQQWPEWQETNGNGPNLEAKFGYWLANKFIELSLVKTGTIIIISELYHRHFWSPEILEKARIIQYEMCGHADPPKAFPDPSGIVQGLLETKSYKLEYFDECFSIPEDHEILKVNMDEDVKSHFRNRRFAILILRLKSK